jgi:hypothetical protein
MSGRRHDPILVASENEKTEEDEQEVSSDEEQQCVVSEDEPEASREEQQYYVEASDDEKEECAEEVPIEEHRLLIEKPKPRRITQLEVFWRKTLPELTVVTGHMYGEATAGSLWKLWKIIHAEVATTPDDIILDWGMGAAKMLLSKQYFAPFPNMCAIGVEIDVPTFTRAVRNVVHNGLARNMHLLRADSAMFRSWEPATIVMQYDGGAQSFIEPYHQTIMTALFRTPTVRAVFSTKLNLALFHAYFDTGDHGVSTRHWRLVRIPGLCFGGSSFLGNLWVRIVACPDRARAPDVRISTIVPTGRCDHRLVARRDVALGDSEDPSDHLCTCASDRTCRCL